MLHRESTYASEKFFLAALTDLRLFVSAHTQAAAYLIGETAAEKMIAEYK